MSFGDIYDLHCETRGMTREEPILFIGEKARKVLRDYRQQFAKKQVRKLNVTFHIILICLSFGYPKWNMLL